MLIGIDASKAFVENKTGTEGYSYQVIKHLRSELGNRKVILYLDPRVNEKKFIDFELPEQWKTKFLRAPIFWSQIRLSMEILLHPVDALFVPAHTVPLVCPRRTVVTIHGLEYELCPQAYSRLKRMYMRWAVRRSCRKAGRIIAVSENTKQDLIRLYKVPENKIEVVYEGVCHEELKAQSSKLKTITQNLKLLDSGFLLFIGRLEERKNIVGIIEAYEILKNKYNLPHKLVLAGKFGYGENEIRRKIEESKYTEDIVLPGYITDAEKWELMKNAEAFIFATFYEGFGLPILEAQNLGTPVVTSNISSMPEIAGEGALMVDPNKPREIAEAVHSLVSNESLKNDIIKKGLENVKRFSWEKCARKTAQAINGL